MILKVIWKCDCCKEIKSDGKSINHAVDWDGDFCDDCIESVLEMESKNIERLEGEK